MRPDQYETPGGGRHTGKPFDHLSDEDYEPDDEQHADWVEGIGWDDPELIAELEEDNW